MSIDAISSNIITYHLHGLPVEEGAECIVSETAGDLNISSGEKSITISKKSIVEIYIEVENKNIQTDEEDPQRTILHTMMHGGFYKVFDDVPQKRIDRMKYKNLVIVNGNGNMTTEIGLQLANAGIIDFVDGYYSVDVVSRYKPFKEVYNYVADQESLKPEEVMMIACHDWDLFGAKKAGLKTGYIKRKKTIYNPFYEQPDLQSDSLIEIATSLIYDNK